MHINTSKLPVDIMNIIHKRLMEDILYNFHTIHHTSNSYFYDRKIGFHSYLTNDKSRNVDYSKLNFKNGITWYYNKNGILFQKSQFTKEGKLTGLYKYYYTSGILKESSEWLNGNRNGKSLSYNSFGNPITNITYKNNRENGICKYYQYDNNKTICKEVSFYNGYKHGIFNTYKDKKLISKSFYELNSLHGLYTKYYDNGKIKIECMYSDGKEQGINTEYFENGNIKSQTTYVDGQEQGIRTEYFKNGNIKSQTTYVDGRLHGIRKEYYANKNNKLSIRYFNGIRDGISTSYYKNNIINKSSIYDNGKETYIIESNKAPEKIIKNGEYKWYHKNGNLHVEAFYVNGVRNGTTRIFNEDGSLKKEIIN